MTKETLSDKRERIKKMLFNYLNPVDIIIELEKQDKEFIKRLKEEMKNMDNSWEDMMEIIDKLAGDALINHSSVSKRMY